MGVKVRWLFRKITEMVRNSFSPSWADANLQQEWWLCVSNFTQWNKRMQGKINREYHPKTLGLRPQPQLEVCYFKGYFQLMKKENSLHHYFVFLLGWAGKNPVFKGSKNVLQISNMLPCDEKFKSTAFLCVLCVNAALVKPILEAIFISYSFSDWTINQYHNKNH